MNTPANDQIPTIATSREYELLTRAEAAERALKTSDMDMLTSDRLELEVARLKAALRDIAYVGQNGSPVDDPDAVSKWCSQRAKEALGIVPA